MKYKKIFLIILTFFLLISTKLVLASPYAVGTINDPDGYTNIRSGRSLKYPVIGKVYKGEHFLVIKSEGDSFWLAVTPRQKVGYIHKSRVNLLKDNPIGAGVINDKDGYTNIRSGPSTKYPVVTTVKIDEVFVILSLGQWDKIITKKGVKGYIHSNRVIRLVFP